MASSFNKERRYERNGAQPLIRYGKSTTPPTPLKEAPQGGYLFGAALCLMASVLPSSPAFANCMMVPEADFADLDWGSAERFDQGEALMLIQGLTNAPDLMSLPKETEGTITLWALVEGDQVYIIRQTGPTTLCGDEPLPRSTFETGKLRGLPRSG